MVNCSFKTTPALPVNMKASSLRLDLVCDVSIFGSSLCSDPGSSCSVGGSERWLLFPLWAQPAGFHARGCNYDRLCP